MPPVALINPQSQGPLVLTCEHASCDLPPQYARLGLRPHEIEDHIGWDIGAAHVTHHLATRLGATAILSQASRLLIDCNRDLAENDLIVTTSDGVTIPGNAAISEEERQTRIRGFYEPYHQAIDAALSARRPALLLSIHSFTPSMNGCERAFDVGVLFDRYDEEAGRLGRSMKSAGFQVRYNEPYSGLDGLIYSARRHGTRHAVRYLELEINNGLLRSEASAYGIAERLVDSIAALIE